MAIIVRMLDKEKSKNHALHNEKVCDYLAKELDYSDWVITTAFYSSLHFISYKVFPFTHQLAKKQNVRINSFEQYHSMLNLSKSRMGRHERFVKLVEHKCPKYIANKYSRLLELSFTARYADYSYDADVVKEVLNSLISIKEYCLGIQKSPTITPSP